MKYKLQKLCIRLSSVIVVLAVLVLVAVPAFAAPIDYNDYVTDIQVDGDNDLVTVTIPAELAWIVIHDQNGNELYRGDGEIHDIVLADFETYTITICPFGYPWNYQNGLDLLYIPKGTQIATGFGFDLDPHGPLSGLPAFSVSYEYGPTGDYDAYAILDYTSLDFVTHTYVLDPPDGAELMYVLYRCAPISPIDHTIASIYVQDTKMVFTISSLLRQQQATGKTNVILKEVEKQLADQGKTLDDIKQQQQDTNDKLDGIINGDVKPESPDGSDRFDDLEDLESGLLDDSQSGMQQGEQITQNALEVVLQYATAFACAGWIFERFTSLPIFTALLTVSLALGLYAFIVNLAQDISRASVRAERKSHRKDRSERKSYRKDRRNK